MYIGLVIGAGFASGREIFEYFNLSSVRDCTGIVLAAVFFALIAYIVMRMSDARGCRDFDSFVSAVAGRAAPPVRAFMLLYMFCGFFVMLSGSGALISGTFAVAPSWGIFLLAAVCFVTFSFDMRGIVALNAVMVPVMIFGMVFLSIFTLLFGSVPTLAPFERLTRNPVLSSVCYVSYNTITVGAVLVPLSAGLTKKTMLRAAALSGGVLGVLIFLVWSVLNIYYGDIISSQMPLLDIALTYGRTAELAYCAVLFMALCTTAVSHGYGVLSKLRLTRTCDRVLASAVLCLAAAPFARIGFSDLISKLYSAFGYAGFAWLGLLLYKYIRTDF